MTDRTTHYAEALAEELERNPPPCRGCQYYDLCAAEDLACGLFLYYVRQAGSRRIPAERVPTREIYDKVFNDKTEL